MKTTQKKTKTLFLGLALTALASQAMATPLKIDGLYKMQVVIGERVFDDLVTLKSVGFQSLEGTVTVPGNFTAPLVGHLETDFLSGESKIDFSIEAIERGHKISVEYSGAVTGVDPEGRGIFFEGEARDLDHPLDPPFGMTKAVPLVPLQRP